MGEGKQRDTARPADRACAPSGLSPQAVSSEAASPSRKVVTNRCHGGFSLSHEGVLAYAAHKGIKLYPEHDGRVYGYWTYWIVAPEQRPESQDNWHLWSQERRIESNREHEDAELNPRQIARDDPSLVAVVESLGEAANGACAKLEVTEIPADVDWVIEEYDGLEWIAERHQTW